ncbi:hypothetical protein M9H77_03596 [Catharanthus roseus]|uniref:Uncharacterized protein n=1 Tax=Catharanthus roseus TaxID=4058 RepID=A0ACC0CC37_CATRO|nr:hypothetical protein M9H77_03596 [Catharanthus roseus]
MDTIHPVKALLFSDAEIAHGAYGPYFIGVVQKAWILPTNRMISHAQLTISTTHIPVQIINMTEHETTITQMVSNEPSMLYTTVTDDDIEIDHSDEEYVASSQSKSDNDAEDTCVKRHQRSAEKLTLLHDGRHKHGIMTTNIFEALNSV